MQMVDTRARSSRDAARVPNEQPPQPNAPAPLTGVLLLVAEMREQRRMFEAFIQNQGPQRQGRQHDATRAATYADFVATR